MDNNTIHSGTVKFYNVGRLYGFITDSNTGKEYFCHNDNLIDHIKMNDTVTFEIIEGSRGLRATNVRLINNKTLNLTYNEKIKSITE
jgi:CspA family cold shock protein